MITAEAMAVRNRYGFFKIQIIKMQNIKYII